MDALHKLKREKNIWLTWPMKPIAKIATIAYEPKPIGRYSVALGTKFLLPSERDEQLHLDTVFWGYAPGWWDNSPLINARCSNQQNVQASQATWPDDMLRLWLVRHPDE
ncbi:hypothetical protein WP8W19C02_17810 [Enterobacter cloacae]|nr:hypothetical protein [Enterobacter mori]MBW8252584.1 hypothetical protein [Enterobacter mori]BBT90161.1 hypothetical protein WP8W19C02_17810 [Enterobacter cloacae]